MTSNKYLLGELITQRREKNPGGNLPIRGVSKDGLQAPKQIDADTSIYNVYYRNDFVYNPARMELGSIAFNDEFEKAICSSLYEVFFVHRTDLVMPEYLAMFVKNPEFARYCNFIGSGSAREYCRFDNISKIPIYLPSIEEQLKIVNDYRTINKRILLLRSICSNLEEHIISIYKEFVRRIEEENCKQTTLYDLSSFICRGITPDYNESSNEVVLNQKCIRNHMIDFSLARRFIPKAKTEKWVKYGDLLINSTGEGTLGRTAIVLFDSETVTVDSHITIVRPKDPAFMFYIGIWGITHEIDIVNLQEGSTGQTELPRERLKEINLPVPSTEEILELNKSVKPLFELRTCYQKEIQILLSISNLISNSSGTVKGA